MDLRRMVRTMKYAQLEQQPHPKTGVRSVPPSIKFLALAVLVAAVAITAFVFAGSGEPDDAARSLEDPGPDADSSAPESQGSAAWIKAQPPLVLLPFLVGRRL